MAASTIVASGTLSVTLAHAITYLTRSLIVRYSATTIVKLQLALEANLTAQFASSWIPSDPLRGSGRRCLTLSPISLPPRSIFNACKSANVEWSEWIALLGGMEFDLFVDPGSVSVRFGIWDSGKVTKCFTVWSEGQAKEQAQLAQQQARAAAAKVSSKTLAQQLLENDKDEDDQLFALIADEVREPTWLTPMLTQFPNIPAPPRSLSSSPVSVTSAVSTHSRSSSGSSGSCFSFSSNGSSDSYGTATTVSRSSCSPADEQPKQKISRREKARQARVFVDASKTEVTNYDGGKTTVLTGGVMLGGAVQAKPMIHEDEQRKLQLALFPCLNLSTSSGGVRFIPFLSMLCTTPPTCLQRTSARTHLTKIPTMDHRMSIRPIHYAVRFPSLRLRCFYHPL